MSFQIALSGINAINDQIETISNNIANTGTTGFKSGRANFAAMYAGDAVNGVRAASTTQSLDLGGSLVNTGRSLDVAVQGRGYFMARDNAGVMNYTRVGILDVDKGGQVVDTFGRRVQGYGAVAGSAALGPLGDLRVPTGQIAAQASSLLSFAGNLSADWQVPSATPFNADDPYSFNSSTVSVVYDSLGAQHTITQYFVKAADNQIDVHYRFDGADVAGDPTTRLSFGTDGQLVTPAGSVALTGLPTPAGAAPLDLSMDYRGTSQFAGDTTTTTNAADGYTSGTLANVKIGADGAVNAQYSNGQQQRVGTIALAMFPSEGGLKAVDQTSWIASTESGQPLVSAPGAGQAGELVSGALEGSNVDVTQQLVELMGAQRNYQANTKVISASNEMVQALMQAV